MHLYQCVFALSRVSYKILFPAAPGFGISSNGKKYLPYFVKFYLGLQRRRIFCLVFCCK